MTTTALPLSGRTALATGVTRRRGIGFAVARRLITDGASVFIGHHAAHDAEQPWGMDDLDAVRAELAGGLTPGALFGDAEVDLSSEHGPNELFEQAVALTGSLEVLVCNHARSGGDGGLLDVDASMLDSHFSTNARATVLLTRLFARAFTGLSAGPTTRPGDVAAAPNSDIDVANTGRVVWLTSGQARPMPGEVAYVASKAAISGLVPTAAAELVRYSILLNAINPGPVNTGYLDADTADRSADVIAEVMASLPLGRFGEPDDVARIVAWLVGPEGSWMNGQVITHDSGFSL